MQALTIIVLSISVLFVLMTLLYISFRMYFYVNRPPIRIMPLNKLENKNEVVIVQAFDDNFGKKIGYETSKHNKLWAQKHGYRYHLSQKTSYLRNENGKKIMPHFMRYFALLDQLKDPTVLWAIYLDGDAVLNHKHKFVLTNFKKEITFGNEVADIYGNFKGYGALNSGYIAAKNSSFVHDFLTKILTSDICEACRESRCGPHGFRDQGCIDQLLLDMEPEEKKKLVIGKVQNKIYPTNRLLIHPAGSKPKELKKLLKYIRSNPIE